MGPRKVQYARNLSFVKLSKNEDEKGEVETHIWQQQQKSVKELLLAETKY